MPVVDGDRVRGAVAVLVVGDHHGDLEGLKALGR